MFVYVFKSWSPEYEKGKYGSARVAAIGNGSTQFHKLLFYVCHCESTRVGAGESGIRCRSTQVKQAKKFTMRSAFRECSHTQPDLEPGP